MKGRLGPSKYLEPTLDCHRIRQVEVTEKSDHRGRDAIMVESAYCTGVPAITRFVRRMFELFKNEDLDERIPTTLYYGERGISHA